MRGTINPLLAVLGIVAASVLAYFPSFAALHGYWTDTDARAGTHGYLVVAVCVWLLWERRKALLEARCEPVPVALVASVALSLVWLIGLRANIQLVHIMLVPIILLVAIYAATGRGVLNQVAFPILFLYFAFPMWGPLTGVLQALTVKAVAVMVHATGVPAVIEQSFIILPSGTFEVADGCSGRQYLTVGLALGAMQGELARGSFSVRLKLIAVMGGLAVLCNWVRVYALVVIGHLSEMKNYLVAVDHYWFGWVLYGLFVAVFLYLARRIEASAQAQPAPSASSAVAAGARWPVYAATLLGIVIVPGFAIAMATSAAEGAASGSLPLPAASAPWSGPLAGGGEWSPVYRGARRTERVAYVDERGSRVDVFVAVYRTQAQGAELVGYDNSLTAEDESLDDETVRTVSGREFREAVVTRRSRPQALLWWVYDVGGRETVRPLTAQLWYGLQSLHSAPVSTIRAFRASCAADCESARTVLGKFAPAMAPRIQDSIKDAE